MRLRLHRGHNTIRIIPHYCLGPDSAVARRLASRRVADTSFMPHMPHAWGQELAPLTNSQGQTESTKKKDETAFVSTDCYTRRAMFIPKRSGVMISNRPRAIPHVAISLESLQNTKPTELFLPHGWRLKSLSCAERIERLSDAQCASKSIRWRGAPEATESPRPQAREREKYE